MKSDTVRPPLVRLFDDEGCIDGFAGGGGTSTGIEWAIGRSPDVAINHDKEALAMHEANHPQTHHIKSNIRQVDYRTVLNGKRCRFAWFSPDCTFHSKARGGRPFRDPNRARRIRGLAWELVRCAEAIRPDMLFMENVEEFKDWCPLKDGAPDASKKGASFRRWVARLRNMGGIVEWRELIADQHGAPTRRKRLFVIVRFDGKPIAWPAVTHGPKYAQPYRTAAECIDFTLPVPSIFLNKREAKAWGKARGVAAPKRPLATATLRRIARGIQRFVLDAAEPFIIPVTHQGDERCHSVNEPLRTITTSERGEFALVTPFLAGVGGRKGQSPETTVDRPFHTITAKADTVLVAPSLVRISHGEQDSRGKKRGRGEHAITEPLPTQTTSNDFALMVPTLINTRNGERHGKHGEQAPRAFDIQQPYNTITAQGSQGALVAAFLAKHNGGHEATGQKLQRPVDTIVCRENKALVTSSLLKLRGDVDSHPQTAQDVREPAPTITASGTHIAEVRAFLVKYFGSKKDGRPVTEPIDTLTTKERFGLVTVTIAGEEYAIVDIGMRMLTPRELFKCQGFPATYEIEHVMLETELGLPMPTRLTKKAQTRMVGNSVPPHLAAALLTANLREARIEGAA